MIQPAKFVLLTVLLAAAGCSTTPRQYTTKERPPDVDLAPGMLEISPRPAPAPESAPLVVPPVALPTNPPPRPPAVVIPPQTWIPLARWAETSRAGTLTNLRSPIAPTFALNTPTGTLILRAGSLLARWSGIELRLGNPPQVRDGELVLHTLDLQKNVLPLLEASPLRLASRVIVLDPGHGGHDSGTRSILPGKWEKEYTLDLARRLAPLLESAGWTVHLTRTNDADVPLQARVDFAEECKADLFLSLHFNATTAAMHAGIETYCLTPVGLSSSVTRNYEDNIALEFPNNRFDAQNLQLAARLHRAALIATGAEDRGVRRARFMVVLRGQRRPAVLMECGYLSSSTEAKAIDKPEYRQKLAEAIAQALP